MLRHAFIVEPARANADVRHAVRKQIGRRPGAVERFRRLRHGAGGGEIFEASDGRPLSGDRKIMAVTPGREPIGAHDDARLVIVEHHRRGANAVRPAAAIRDAVGVGSTKSAARAGVAAAMPNVKTARANSARIQGAVPSTKFRLHFIRRLYCDAGNRGVTLIAAAILRRGTAAILRR